MDKPDDVAEDVHEQLAAGRSHEAIRARSCIVVPHVLEHLDRDHAIEVDCAMAEIGGFNVIDIGGDHAQVARAARARLRVR